MKTIDWLVPVNDKIILLDIIMLICLMYTLKKKYIFKRGSISLHLKIFNYDKISYPLSKK